jgi:ethanolamine utilization protein EutA (predicted chaperonin)
MELNFGAGYRVGAFEVMEKSVSYNYKFFYALLLTDDFMRAILVKTWVKAAYHCIGGLSKQAVRRTALTAREKDHEDTQHQRIWRSRTARKHFCHRG